MRFKIRRIVFFLVLFTVLLFMVYLHSQLEPLKNEGIIHASSISTSHNTPMFNITKATTVAGRNRSNKICKNLKWPGNVTEKQMFEQVTDSDLYVFSAFFDDVDQYSPNVRVIGFKTRYRDVSIKCQVWYDGQSTDLIVIPGNIRRIPEDHGFKYGAIYIMCPLPDKKIPFAVSIVRDTCQEPSNRLKVIHFEKKEAKFTVCVTPFNFRYSRAYELVEWIEMNRLLGAEYFTFYNHSTGVNVDRVLQLYASKGLVNIVQWHLPMNVDHWPPSQKPEVHYFGQLASLNDCLYRNVHRTKYLVYEDLDEVLIPRQDRNWTSLLSSRTKNATNIGAFLFRCIFFRKDWPKLEEDFKGMDIALKYKSIFLFTSLREMAPLPYHQRSKFIIEPQKVDTVGIHNIWGLRPVNVIDKVPESQGLLHHYRNWEKPNEKLARMKDLYVHTFADALLPRLKDIWSQLKDVRLDIPLSEYPSPV